MLSKREFNILSKYSELPQKFINTPYVSSYDDNYDLEFKSLGISTVMKEELFLVKSATKKFVEDTLLYGNGDITDLGRAVLYNYDNDRRRYFFENRLSIWISAFALLISILVFLYTVFVK